jgi:palmitoyltransferase
MTYAFPQIHPCQKDLGCPGCGLGPFDRPSNLIRHFEDGSCLRISWSTIEELREKRLQFAKGLQQLTQDTVKNHYAQFMPSASASNGGISFQVRDDELLADQKHRAQEKEISTDKAESPVDKEAEPWGIQPFHVKDEEFPGLPSEWNKENKTPTNRNSIVGAETKDSREEDTLAWTMKKNLFPNARPAAAPTGEQLAAATAPGVRMMYEAMDRDHPNHPNFDVERFYVGVNKNYGCPRVRC